MNIPETVKNLLEKHHFIVVATLDKDGIIHTSAKAVIEVDQSGKVFILDLYKGKTYDNIKNNSSTTITVIDEHKFKGYSVKGRSKIFDKASLPKEILEIWDDKISKRIARRVIKHVKGEESGHSGVPEARFPVPKYLIELTVDSIVDLAPQGIDK